MKIAQGHKGNITVIVQRIRAKGKEVQLGHIIKTHLSNVLHDMFYELFILLMFNYIKEDFLFLLYEMDQKLGFSEN